MSELVNDCFLSRMLEPGLDRGCGCELPSSLGGIHFSIRMFLWFVAFERPALFSSL